MKRHLLLIGFSCTGKTSLGEKAFEDRSVLDSDDEVLAWIENATGNRFDHIYQVYMGFGRDKALTLIANAEQALIAKWALDSHCKIISLGPGFPLHQNWSELRAISHVVLFRRSAKRIYDSLKKRRSGIFRDCPEAKRFDNWDVGVIVDSDRREYSPQVAIANIRRLLAERERYYQDNETEVDTDNWEDARRKLAALKGSIGTPT